MRWLTVSLIIPTLAGLGLAIAGAFILHDAYSTWHTEHYGIAGTVEIRDCESYSDDNELKWTCHGAFTSTDGTTRIDRVRLQRDITSDSRPAGTSPAIVRDAEGDLAVAPGHWLSLLLSGLLMLGVGGWLAITLGAAAREVNSDDVRPNRARNPNLRLRLCQLAITVLGLLATVGVFYVALTEPVVCTEAAPCGPDPAGNLLLGALVATCFVAWIHPWAAALSASVAWLGLIWQSDEALTLPAVGISLGFATAMCLLAWFAQKPRQAVDAPPASASPQRVPATQEKPVNPGRTWVIVLLGAAIGLAAISVLWQQQADAQTAKARVVEATVESHTDDGKIELRLADGQVVPVPVLSQANYPVGGVVRISWDTDGLAQPLAEPYNASGWLMLATLLLIPGLGIQMRRWQRSRAWRRLTGEPQPVSPIWYLRENAAIYPIDVQPYDPPIGTFVEEARLVLDRYAISQTHSHGYGGGIPVRAVLYGRRGLCAVLPEGEQRLIIGACTQPSDEPWLPTWHYLCYLEYEPRSVPEKAADAYAHQVQMRRFDPVRTFLGAVIVPGVLVVLLLGGLDPQPIVSALLVAAAVAGVLVAAWWWLVIRPVILWNGGGVTIANHSGTHKYRWSEVDRIEDRVGYVRVTTYDGRHASVTSGTDSFGDRFGIEASNSLHQSLEQSRSQASVAVDPPEFVARPGTAMAVTVAFAIVCLLATLTIQW